MRKLPVPILVLAGLFGIAMTWLVGDSLATHTVPTYVPRSRTPGTASRPMVDTVTIDARDPERWQFFAFDTGGWDIAVRRFHVMVAGDAIGIDSVPFEALHSPPSVGYVATTFDRDTVNAAIARWYRYSMFSHLLRPKRRIYVIRSRSGRATKLEFLSYYCPGPEPACVTFRFETLR
jgi:hypothetical protein